MSLQNLMAISARADGKKQGLSLQRLTAILPIARQYIAYWREYPDMFVDFLCGGDQAGPGTLHLFYYQRVFLRAVMRHRYVYATFPRAYSKSFLSILVLMLRCILYPGSHLFITSGGKQQATAIAKEKVGQLCKLIPGLKNEINWERGMSKQSKDMVVYIFKNGSVLDIIAARASSRGRRATGGLMEQCILIDGDMLNQVIIPKCWGLVA